MIKTHGFKEFSKYVSLNILGMLGLSCYILADTYFIANGIGASGLAALNLAIPIYSLVHGCGLMLGMGGATKFSVTSVGGDSKIGNRIFMSILYIAAALSALFVMSGLFLSGQISRLLGADSEIYDLTRIYIRWILLFSPAFILNNIVICFVRNDGSPRLSMVAMLTGSFANILLDYIFIFPLHMGMFGAVFATGCAPVISLSVLSVHFLKHKNRFAFTRSRPEIKLALSAMSLGLPSFINELSSGIVMIVFNSVILGLMGNIGVAAYGVVANIALVAVSVYTGISQGVQPIISKAHGLNDLKKVKQMLVFSLASIAIVSTAIYLSVFTFADPIAALFNSEKNLSLQNMAVSGLKIYFIASPFIGLNILLPVFFTSMEKAVPAQAISLLRGLILIVPAAFLLARLFGMTGVWTAVPITETVVSVIGSIMLLSHFRTSRTSD